MSARQVVDRYSELATTVARMLELARSRRWALLPLLDAECAAIAAQLRGTEAPAFSPAEVGELQAIASRIESDRALLNALVRPQFTELVRRLRESSPAA